MRRVLIVLAALALAAVLVVGLSQAGGEDDGEPDTAQSFDLAEAKRSLAGAPAPLAGLYGQSNAILNADPETFDARLDDLAGTPVVINKWASWCGPCRSEFPIFQQVAAERGKEVAFVGLNAGDKRPAAETFLEERPLPYPSFEDPDEEIAETLRAAKYFPMTVFIDARGEIEFTKAGEYRTAEDLEADIDRYLGG